MYAIDARNISKMFESGKESLMALNRVSLKVKEGEIYGLLGPNGAGKTTLINILTSIMLPTSGRATVLGYDLVKDYMKIRKNMGVCFGGGKFNHYFTPVEILNLYGRMFGMNRTQRKKKIAELVELLEFKHYMNTRFTDLSKGMKQKVSLAKSLINDPKLLFMDEPTVGLDVDISISIRELLRDISKEKGTTILLTSHYMHDIEVMCKKISVLNRGRVVKEGRVDDIKKQFRFFDDIYVSLNRYTNLEFLKKIKGVSSYEITDNELLITVRSSQKTIEPILKEFKKRKYQVRSLEIKKASLEDAFLKIVGGKNA